MSCTCGQDQMVDGRNSEKEAELMRAVIPGASGLSAIHHRDAEGTFWDPASIALSSAPQRQVRRLLRSCMKKAPKGLG
jgi:hypothetical protein